VVVVAAVVGDAIITPRKDSRLGEEDVDIEEVEGGTVGDEVEEDKDEGIVIGTLSTKLKS
jgi:hypothetical protein